jgi:hypothetical protein
MCLPGKFSVVADFRRDLYMDYVLPFNPILRAFENLPEGTVSYVMPVLPQGTTRLPLNRFS